MKELLPGLLAAILPLLLAALTFVSERLARFIDEKTKNERVQVFLLRLNEESFAVVREVAQTYADGLRKDGSFDESAAQKAKAMALQKLKNRLGPLAIEQAKKAMGLDDEKGENLLQGRIEAAIHSLKEIKPITLETVAEK
jgi:hypothetical protein